MCYSQDLQVREIVINSQGVLSTVDLGITEIMSTKHFKHFICIKHFPKAPVGGMQALAP